ncbi:MAG TPA: LysR family transcriptional regulator [Acetobacteraceae bacterium]|nr:LysR family transcriptional regulator [Acetobacteraceae bacterium]
MHFDLVDLRLFARVAETATITQAAAMSGLALASASERIRGMEAQAGVALLRRGRRGVTLTPAGHALAHHARMVLQQFDQLTGALSKYAGGLRGFVRLAANGSACSEFLPERLSLFLRDNPGIDVDLEEKPSFDIVRLVAEGFADIGVVADIVDFAGLQAFPFARDRLVVVLPRAHPLAGQGDRHFRDLLGHEFIGMPAGNALQQHVSQHAAQAGRPLKLRIRLNSFEAICRMVETGVGIAVLPETAARRCRRSMAITTCRLADGWALRQLHVCLRSAPDLPGPARRLAEHLIDRGTRPGR